jgi:Ca2+-binding RTX toxin-like protein
LGNSSQLPDAALRLATGAVPSGLGAINVTGHSLGGHLAMAFTRLFPSITSSASVVNALGFKIGNSTVDSLFSILGGAPTFNAASILNVYGFAGPEFAVMNNGVLQQPGGFEGIFIENGGLSTIGGHSSVQMTDSAAVYDLFFRLSSQIHNAEPASALATLKSLYEAASSQADASLERIVDSLVNLFQLDFPPLTGSLTNNRDELYKRIVPLQAITKNLSDNNPGMHVDVLATSSATAASLALLASGSTALAYRYALKELNPFAIVGDNALYSLHNQSGELELYDPISGSGTLTEMWIKDRAEFFVSQNKSAIVDGEITLRHPTKESLQYIDKNLKAADGENDLTVNIAGTSRLGLSNPYKIVFGSDGNDVIEGSNLLTRDRLYGEEGDDFLVGGGGNDYLEGGRGFDIYAWDDADGVDSILDVDGQGVLLHNGVAVSGGNGYGYGKYRSDDGFFEFLKQDGRLYVNGSVIVEDFENGDLGILLNDQLIAYAPPENLITASKDKSVGTVGDDYFLAGQLQTNPDGLPGGPLWGEVFNSLSGSDIVESTDNVGEFRVVFGGSGDDELHAIAAPYRRSSYLIGEGGRDFIVGDIADDVIYGDGISGLGYLVPAYSAGELVGFSINYSTLFPHLPSYHRHEHVSTEYDFNADTLKSFIEGDPGNITNEIIVNVGGWQGAMGFLGLGNELGDQLNSDFLFGGDGNDVLYGGAGEDVVEGGAGNDRLYGGHGYSRWGAISGTESDPYFSATWTDSGSDTLLGDAGDDYLVDADDNAVINILDGGGGDDVLVASHRISDFFNDIEDILADSLPTPFSSLLGGEGSDFLVARGTGSFVLDGGAGADTYWVFDATQTVVLEKQPDLGEDTLLISNFSQPLIPELSYQAITTLDEYRSNPFFSPSKFTNFPGPGMPPDVPGQLFQRVNDDLLIQFGGSIYVKDWFVGSANKLQAIVFGSEVSFDDQVPTGQLDLFDVEWSAMGGISIDASVIDAVINDSPNLIVSEPGDVEVAGGQSADYLYGSAGNNFIVGGDGDDLLDGGAGNDILLGEMGHDELYGGLGIDLLSGGLDGDFLVGELGRGVLDGGDSQDIISLLGGEYFVIGGLGNDILNVNSPGSILAFNPGDGNDFITVSSDFILSIGGLIAPADLTLSDLGEDILLEVGEAESLLFSRQYDPEGNPLPWKNITLQLFGSAHLYDFNGAIEALYNQADDRLALGDVLHGLEFEASEFSGLGGVLANAYQLHGNLDTLTDEEIRAVLASPDFGLSLQPLNLGETLIGTADTDELTGGPGNDLLDGREGADILRGSAGNDRYVVDQTDDVVIELVAEGRDAVSSSVTNTLSANVEVLTLTGESDINGTGNTLDNEIFGNAGANRLDGKAGGDVLRGGLGNDTYVVDNINDFVDEQDESDVDAVVSSIDYILSTHLENLTLSGTALNGSGNAAANRLTGNARDNLLQGLGGNDVLNGGTGADTLIGGTGDDSYLVDNDADHVIELAAEGMDTIQSSVSHTLADHVENLTLTGTAANQGSGNTLDNRLTGNAADNVLEGFAGNDTLDGKVGADQMAVLGMTRMLSIRRAIT